MDKKDPLKILFIHSMELEIRPNWKDGLWAALHILDGKHNLTVLNLQSETRPEINQDDFDAVLAWGGFNSPADKFVDTSKPAALLLGGYAKPTGSESKYDLIFTETEWSRGWLKYHNIETPTIHAFGINTDIFKDLKLGYKVWDYISVGAFSLWKRQDKMLEKPGYRKVIGQIQHNNLIESMKIISQLVLGGVAVSDAVDPDRLCYLYNLARYVYIPATEIGGGERAVLEARSCGAEVEVEYDNRKLQELLDSPIWDHHYYARQLEEGIWSLLE